MTCDKDNIGSVKSIVKNGGVFENEFINSEGHIEQRYWISIGKSLRDGWEGNRGPLFQSSSERDFTVDDRLLGFADILKSSIVYLETGDVIVGE